MRLDAVTACVPANEVNLEDEAKYYNGNLKKIKRLKTIIGLDKRRICPPGITAADLCFQAANELIKERNIDRDTIDALLFLSQSPDYPFPATACDLQNRLGLSTNCAAIDLSQGCAGYIYGMWMAASLIASGSCRNVLLLCGDGQFCNPENRIVTPVFGHGGSASYFISDPSASKMYFELLTDGSGFELIIRPAGGARRSFSLTPEADHVLYEDILDGDGNPWRLSQTYMDGKAIYDFTQRVVPEHISSFLKRCSVNPDDIDKLFLHQANKQIVELVAEKAGFAHDRDLSKSFSKYGNLACASIPVQMCEIMGSDTRHKGLMLCCGYGIGLSWGSALMEMKELHTQKVGDYIGTVPETPERDFIEHWFKIFGGQKNDRG